MSGRRHLATAERLLVPLDLGMQASQMGVDLTVDLGGDSDLTEDSDSVVDSDAGVAALVLDGVGAGDGIRGGGAAGDRRGGAGGILAIHTGA